MKLVRAAVAALSIALLSSSAISQVEQTRTTRDLFASYDVVSLRLEAPLDELFEKGKGDAQPDYTVTGVLSYSDRAGHDIVVQNVEINVRGNTSRRENECSFPKLKLRFQPASVDQTIFRGLKSVKIGTHCGDETAETLTAKYGRVSSEVAAHREAFVYRLLEAMDVPSLKARPARVTYVFGGRSIVRDAMLLEDTGEAVKRFGGIKELGEREFRTARDDFAAADTVTLAFAEAMIGNFDWCLKFFAEDRYRCDARHPLWNISPVVRRDGPPVLLIDDFDLAGMVTGRHAWFDNVFNEAFVPSRSHARVEVLSQLQRTRSLFARAELDAARARFLGHKADAFRVVQQAGLDPKGRTQIEDYLNGFFEAIGSNAAFYLPVVVKPNTVAYGDASHAAPVCTTGGAVPVGTPVSAPIQTRGGMSQVIILDALWHWQPDGCTAIRTGPVWIDQNAVDSNYPQ